MSYNWVLSEDGTCFEDASDPDWEYGTDAKAHFIVPGLMAIFCTTRGQSSFMRINVYKVPKNIPDKLLFLNVAQVEEMCKPFMRADFDPGSGEGDEELFNSLYFRYVDPTPLIVRFRKPSNSFRMFEAVNG